MRPLYHPGRDELELTVVLHALSDPMRLQLSRDLSDGSEQCCKALSLEMPKSTASHHLKILREAGVTYTRIEGTRRYVSLRLEDLEARFPGLMRAVFGAAAPASV